MSIKQRIILIFTALTALIVAVLAGVSYYSVREIYLDQLAEQTHLLARLIGSSVDAKYLTFVEGDFPTSRAVSYYQEKMALQAQAMLVESAFIFDGEFTILARSSDAGEVGSRDSRLLLNRSEILNLPVGGAITSLPFKGNDGQWYLWGFYRLNSRHWVGVQESAGRLERVESLARTFWGIGIAGVLLTMFCGWGLARTLARPIDRLVEFSRRLGQQDFSAPLPAGVSGELAILATAMDKMRRDLARHHREKEAMLAQIAHEIRNPLGGIELLAGLVKEDLQKNGISDDYIQKILTEISGLKSLITAYLNYSRPAPAMPEAVDVGGIVEEVRASLEQKLRQKKVALHYRGNGHSVIFDRQHLRQILQNLVANSLEMLDEGGRIEVAVQKNPGGAVIRVSDTGPGIAPAEREKIFEPFFTTRSNGTGLGLAICRKLCRENGAEIFAEDHAPHGCTFIIQKESGGRE